jgi:hypothetical protein
MKTDKSFEARFAVGWEEGEKMLIRKNRKFWKRIILIAIFGILIIFGIKFII